MGDTAAISMFIIGLTAWIAWAFLVRWIVGVRPYGDDGAASALLRFIQLYAHLWQRASYEGLAHIPAATPEGRPGEPVIIVSNHTAGIDPILIQAACPFAIRFMMAQDMRVGLLEGFWRYGRVLFIDRENPTGMELREAIAHVKSGGALGMFPQGAIARPAHPSGAPLPFREGVGLIVRRADARVLPVAISGTPASPTAWGSILRRGPRVRVRFLPMIHFGRDADAASIAESLGATIGGTLADDSAPTRR